MLNIHYCASSCHKLSLTLSLAHNHQSSDDTQMQLIIHSLELSFKCQDSTQSLSGLVEGSLGSPLCFFHSKRTHQCFVFHFLDVSWFPAKISCVFFDKDIHITCMAYLKHSQMFLSFSSVHCLFKKLSWFMDDLMDLPVFPWDILNCCKLVCFQRLYLLPAYSPGDTYLPSSLCHLILLINFCSWVLLHL